MTGMYYTSERNIQVVIALLKANNISRVFASPGATNISFVGSIQNDPFFTIYSCIDERSAAYMACGMAAETGVPVVISCTGATSSRNWMPGLTEAFYRKLPILAISSSNESCLVGHLVAQVTNRSTPPADAVIRSLEIGLVKSQSDEWDAVIKANTAISLLTRNGGGPVHINLITGHSRDFSVKEIAPVRMIKRYRLEDGNLPEIPAGRVAIAIGGHIKFKKEQENLIDDFCACYDAVVFCDHSSGYNGKYKTNLSLSIMQKKAPSRLNQVDLLIHIGEVSGDYYGLYKIQAKQVWRVNPDGEIRDLYKSLTAVFDMPEISFFKTYLKPGNLKTSYIDACNDELEELYKHIPDLPFSNLWIAQHTASKLPKGSALHLGILNSLRSWNFFKVDNSIDCSCNVGGFGIDGAMSTLIGASLCNSNRLYFGVLGDLAFFYDMNAVGNRHVGNNVRFLVVNNGRGQEFRNYSHNGSLFGSDADKYIAAAGHFGKKSRSLVKGIAESLGYKYFCAENKSEFLEQVDEFVAPINSDRPFIFEVFTETEDESVALEMITNCVAESKLLLKNKIKESAKELLGDAGIRFVKKAIGKK